MPHPSADLTVSPTLEERRTDVAELTAGESGGTDSSPLAPADKDNISSPVCAACWAY
jgi:hypothetical protein